MNNIEKQLKALANRRRLAIIVHLRKHKEATVGDIAEAIRLSFKSTSKHMSILYAAGIVEKEQRSLAVYYALAKELPKVAKSVIGLL